MAQYITTLCYEVWAMYIKRAFFYDAEFFGNLAEGEIEVRPQHAVQGLSEIHRNSRKYNMIVLLTIFCDNELQ